MVTPHNYLCERFLLSKNTRLFRASKVLLLQKYIFCGKRIARHIVKNNGEYVDILTSSSYADISLNHILVANINPFRYRGYYYDTESGLYYLNTRYYDPETGRFINADDISILAESAFEINGLSLFAYCFNNPVNDIDENGNLSWKRAWQKVKNFFSNTVDAVITTSKNIYQKSIDFIVGWVETSTDWIFDLGKSSKFLTFFMEKPEDWYKFWDYQFGVSINIGKFNLTNSMGLLDLKFSVGFDSFSVDFIGGIRKIGLGYTYTTGNISNHGEIYIKPWVILGLVLMPYVMFAFGGSLIPVVA